MRKKQTIKKTSEKPLSNHNDKKQDRTLLWLASVVLVSFTIIMPIGIGMTIFWTLMSRNVIFGYLASYVMVGVLGWMIFNKIAKDIFNPNRKK